MDLIWVGVYANKDWILGNWIRECSKRLPLQSKIWWSPFSFAKNNWVERYIPPRLPEASAYFFSYPTLFKKYLGQKDIGRKSIVLYTHNEQPELSTDEDQVSLLNKAHSVHFFSSHDASRLKAMGLKSEKIRLVNGAVDIDMSASLFNWDERDKTVLMASKFGYRKGPDKIPSIVRTLPDWKFILLGRGWENFLNETALLSEPNFEYLAFNKQSRNEKFPRSKVFLSTSILEGGPIPLLEAMFSGMFPVVSNTGFAIDLLGSDSKHHVFDISSNTKLICEMISSAFDRSAELHRIACIYSWDRISRIVYQDFLQICMKTIN